jgi:hypothetical protein
MQTDSGHGIALALLFLVPILGCSPPPPPSGPPSEPPPAYGPDPFQTGAAVGPTTGIGIGGMVPAPAVLTQKEAEAYIGKTIDERQAQLAKGFTLEGEISSDKIAAGDEKAFAVVASKGGCLRILAVSDPGVPQIDLYLYDGETLLDRDVAVDNYPVVSSCFDKDKEVKLVLKVVSGSGWFVIRVFSKKNDGTVKKTMDAMEKTH